MKKMIFVLLFAVGMSQVQAGELADKKAWEVVDGYMKEASEALASADYCGVKLPFNIDKKSFAGDKIEWGRTCSQALGGISSFCTRNAEHKAEIVKAIKSMNCRYDASLKTDKNHALKVTFKNGVLDVSLNKDSSNFDDEIVNVLDKEI